MNVFIKSILVIFWSATFAVVILWTTGIDLPFDPEPVAQIFSSLSTALSVCTIYFAKLLKNEKFSTPKALAHGYFYNFLYPAANELQALCIQKGDSFSFQIYIPKSLNEIDHEGRKTLMNKIRNSDFQDEIIKLTLSEGVERDVITLKKLSGKNPIYFDFPTTLLTLNALVSFNTSSDSESFANDDKKKLTDGYLKTFKEYLQELINKVGLKDTIHLNEGMLDFLKDS